LKYTDVNNGIISMRYPTKCSHIRS